MSYEIINEMGNQASSEASKKLTVIILTYNEEKNIGFALDSISGWADDIIILDSYSTDKTLKIAKEYNCTIVQNHFESYAKQRNFALENLSINTEWILFLDADEWLPNNLKQEISSIIKTQPEENGFYVKFRLIWMDKWIRRGYYPTWILRLFCNGKARCDSRATGEHLIVEGNVGHLKHDFIHQDCKGITEWINKHNRYATREAEELFKTNHQGDYIDANFFGTQAQRKRWIRYKIWNHLPPLIRPFIYFFYRYFLAGGFLDGRAAFIYHFLQALWFPLLIDIKYLELKYNRILNKEK